MSLVENLVNQISNNGLGGITKPQGFDLNDDTFEKLLQGMNMKQDSNQSQLVGSMGVPAGMVIEPIDAPETTKEIKPIDTSAVEIKDFDMSDFFTNIIKTQNVDENGIFDLAKKHAANAYNSFAGKYVENIKDFITDTMALS